MRAVSVLTLLLCARSAAAFASHLPLHHRTAGRIPAVRTSAGDLSSSSLEAVGGSWDVQPSSSSAKPPSPLAAAAVLGVGTSCMGTAYAKALKASVTAVWISAPAAFKLADPTLYIPAICTLGGALIGLLAANLQSVGMPNFIAKQQSDDDSLPGVRPFLAPLLLLSLLTSTFGFSVGPEAPMVVAGALVGSAFAKRVYGDADHAMARTMAYAGAAGALTTFIGMPLAGAIFVLEITRASSGLSAGAFDALSPAIMSSCASMIVAKALFAPAKAIGGHFAYGAIGNALSGRAMAAIALCAGCGGALIGRVFVMLVAALKRPMWPQAPAEETCEADKRWACGPKTRHVLVKTTVGLCVGILGLYFPQTLFWGEGSLQHVLDGQRTALSAVWPGLPESLTARALVGVSAPFASASAAFQVGAAKLAAIALACAGGFPGGIIFPLFFASSAIAHAVAALVPPVLMPVWVMSLMAATQASVTRTPLATIFMLGLSAAASAELAVLMPPVIIASYVGVWASRLLSTETFFPYSKVD